MLRQIFRRILTGGVRRTGTIRGRRADASWTPTFESLDGRWTPAITAFFSAPTGILTVLGDSLDNTITIERDAAGVLLVNGGAVTIAGGTATVANTAEIQVFGQNGHDTITLNEANGALPKALLFGGNGNDTLTGGSAGDFLFGQAGNDVLFGMGGSDFLFGGDHHDVLIGGDGDDQIFGEAGNDRMIWNPGDDIDLFEGGEGTDTVEVNGGNGDEIFTVTANGGRVRFDRLDPAPFAIDIGTSEKLVVNGNGGNDFVSATGNLAALIHLTFDGGAGNDTLIGGNGADLLIGGEGNDFIDGNQGNDTVLMGAGDDVFQWDPGDGSDVVDGGGGVDTLRFIGSNAGEIFTLSANGSRVRFTRNIGNVTMDLKGIERVDLETLGGADTVVMNDLSKTEVVELNVNLAGTLGGSNGDSQIDQVIVTGTHGADVVNVIGSGGTVSVVGLPTLVKIHNAEGANDQLTINASSGHDLVSAATLNAGLIGLFIDGGIGNDTLTGSQGADTILGGDGADLVEGGQGNDLVLLGAGNDRFVWNPGDGSDIVEGQGGFDTLQFNGSAASEQMQIAASSGRVFVFRDVGNVTVDTGDIERINIAAFGGADQIFVGDLSGSSVTEVHLDLAGSVGGSAGDGQQDTVIINGTNGADQIVMKGSTAGASVTGLHATVHIRRSEANLDRIQINGLGGNDVIDASGTTANVAKLALHGGLGDDVLIGSAGADEVFGGDGNDLAILGAGDDTFVWNPGDDNDTVEGGTGNDTLIFNGANVAEIIDISSNGGRVRFTRNVASVVMDLNGLEVITFNALGGADTVVVNDLAGTDVQAVNINLAAINGAGDGQPDTVHVHGTNGNDVILVTGSAGLATVFGLHAQVNITGAESNNDRVVIHALDGDDVVEASGLTATGIGLTAHGGNGNDVLIGGDGADVLTGGEGDDVLIGGPGLDILDGGPGDNIVIQG